MDVGAFFAIQGTKAKISINFQMDSKYTSKTLNFDLTGLREYFLAVLSAHLLKYFKS